MSFTTAQKVKIRGYVGYPIYPTSATELESAMDVTGADSAMQAEVEAVLAAIALVETEISGTVGYVVFNKAEEVGLDARRDANLRTRGRREVRRLCSLLGFDDGPMTDVFAAGWGGGDMGWSG